MPHSMNGSALTAPVNSLDGVRPQMARAELSVNVGQTALTAIVKDGLIRAYGSLKAAALAMDMDQGQMTRELDSGKLNLARLERLDPIAKAQIAARMHDEYAALSDPKAYIDKRLKDVEEAIAEFRQFIQSRVA